jgi:transcriptional regulator with XRE-family HTH domain
VSPLISSIGRQIKYWRGQQGYSQQRLAEEVTQLGVKLTAAMVTSIEAGHRRDAASVHEVFAIAYVLDMPPLLLMLPLGRVDEVEIVPGVAIDPDLARKWLAGEMTRRGEYVVHDILGYFRDHAELVTTVLGNRQRGEQVLAENFTEHLLALRKNMRRARVRPPKLPAELADLDPEA